LDPDPWIALNAYFVNPRKKPTYCTALVFQKPNSSHKWALVLVLVLLLIADNPSFNEIGVDAPRYRSVFSYSQLIFFLTTFQPPLLLKKSDSKAKFKEYEQQLKY